MESWTMPDFLNADASDDCELLASLVGLSAAFSSVSCRD